MPEKEVISNLLKSCRREPPRKQAELAQEIHISRKQVSSLELKKANPSMSILKKIAAYRGLSLAELLWTNKQSPCPPCGDLLPEQIMAVRDTGETNMLDARAVQRIANRERFYELVVYLEEHRQEYANFILTGKE